MGELHTMRMKEILTCSALFILLRCPLDNGFIGQLFFKNLENIIFNMCNTYASVAEACFIFT